MRWNSTVFAIARKELSERLRNRWIWTVSALYVASGLAVAYFGTAPVGVAGLRDGGAAMASLMNLSAYLVPLLALILGCGAIIDEKQRGTLDLTLVYPISTGEYFLGSFLGYAGALILALVCGLVPTGVVLRLWAEIDVTEYLLLLALVSLLAVVFLALSFLVSLLARDRARAVASSVLVWIVAVFVFDLVLVGVLIGYSGEIPAHLFGVLLLLNPSDVYRLLCFQSIGSAASPLGLATVMPPFSAFTLTGVLMLWAAVPLLLRHQIFNRRVATDRLV